MTLLFPYTIVAVPYMARLRLYMDALSQKTPDELAKLLIYVSNNSIDNFFQVVRRKLSILERSLTTSRGEVKSYIYCNYNPRYAQYATTILRTFYDFCCDYKKFDKHVTPAQAIGIADKKCEYKDIIYFV